MRLSSRVIVAGWLVRVRLRASHYAVTSFVLDRRALIGLVRLRLWLSRDTVRSNCARPSSGLPRRSFRPASGVKVVVRLRPAGYAGTGFVPDQWSKTKPGGGGGNRTHVRGTSIAGFSVCSRLVYLASWSVSWQPSARPARKISITADGRDGTPAHLTSSIPDRRAEPWEGRGYLSSQCVVVIGS